VFRGTAPYFRTPDSKWAPHNGAVSVAVIQTRFRALANAASANGMGVPERVDVHHVEEPVVVVQQAVDVPLDHLTRQVVAREIRAREFHGVGVEVRERGVPAVRGRPNAPDAARRHRVEVGGRAWLSLPGTQRAPRRSRRG